MKSNQIIILVKDNMLNTMLFILKITFVLVMVGSVQNKK